LLAKCFDALVRVWPLGSANRALDHNLNHWTFRAGIVGSIAPIRKISPMKIIAYDNFMPGVTLDDLKPYLRDEVSNVWRLWKQGIVRENYARADVGGVIIVFELDSVEDAKRYVADFPLTKAGLLEWEYVACGAPLPLEFLFDPSVDIAEPWDRTMKA
jgi:hypothetical protein